MNEEYDLKGMDLHNKVVYQLEDEIRSLGLMVWQKHPPFTDGFIPDIITNVGGTINDWIIIDVVNRPESLNRVIGGLLVLKANLDKQNQKVRWFLIVATDNIHSIKEQRPLINTYQNFEAIRPIDFKTTLQEAMLTVAQERIKEKEVPSHDSV